MIYALVAMLVLILIIAYVFSEQDLLSPWVIATASFLNSSVLAMLNLKYWQYGFHPDTCLVIASALLFFGAGAILASICFGEKKYLSDKPSLPILIPNWAPVLVAFFSLIMAVVSIQEFYNLSVSYGNTGGYGEMVKVVRTFVEKKAVDMPKGLGIRRLIAYTCSVFFLGVYVHNLIWFGWKRASLLLLLPTVAYLPHIILSTGRLEFLRLTVVLVTMGGIIYQMKKGCSLCNNLRMVGGIAVAFLIFFSAFFGAGALTWKGVSAERTPFSIISHYTGAQIPALDVYINGRAYPENEWVGTSTLLGPYGKLKTMGVDVPPVSMFLDFVYFSNVSTNVYTSLRRYVQDYGFVGMEMIVFLLGLVLTYSFKLVRCGRGGICGLLVYSVLSWPLFLFGHDDLFLTNLISTYTLYMLVMLGMLYWIFLWFLPRRKGEKYSGSY